MFNGLTRDLWLSHMKATMSLFYLAGYFPVALIYAGGRLKFSLSGFKSCPDSGRYH